MKQYTPREEIANVLTHFAGLLFSIYVTVFLLLKSIPSANNWQIYSFLIFGVLMSFSFLASVVYHAIKPGKIKSILQKFDHAAIYTFIAGSYTPFTLIVLREKGIWGWLLFGIIWITALGGLILNFVKLKKPKKVEMAIYIAMGWVVVIAFKPLYDVLMVQNSLNILWWLIGGGIAYTIGSVIYSLKKIEFVHAVWHLFVLVGAICHSICMFLILENF